MVGCAHSVSKLYGKDRKGTQRHRCLNCGVTFTKSEPKPLGNMRISLDVAVQCLHQLLEGSSIRSTERLTGINRNTLMDLLVLVGDRCRVRMERELRDVCVGEVQADEIWGFIGCKEKTSAAKGYEDPSQGDAYCFVGFERNTKLILTWHLGKRSPEATYEFANKLRTATAGRFQLSTDGWQPYKTAIPNAIGPRVDFAQIVKVFGKVGIAEERRYSPPQIIETRLDYVSGIPDMNRVCTSHVERSNLSIRMSVRRMTRLTNAFSKKWENHRAALALFFAYYNFCRVHGTLKTTPAVATGIAERPWTLRELVEWAAK